MNPFRSGVFDRCDQQYGRQDMGEQDRSFLGRMGAFAMHAKHNSTATTKAARDAAFERFVDAVDPQRVLDPADRLKRAKAAQRLHLLRLSARSAEVRRQRRAAR
jgi:hypothetical protein